MTATKGLALFVSLVAAVATERSGAAAGAGGASMVQLKTVSAHARPGGSTVLVETTEPTAYVASRPDPLTILLDLRNVDSSAVKVADSLAKVASAPEVGITGVRVESVESMGAPVSRVRVSLADAVDYQVRSERSTILIDLTRRSSGTAVNTAPSPVVDPIAALGLDRAAGPVPSGLVPVVRVAQSGPGRDAIQPATGLPSDPGSPAALAAVAPASGAQDPADSRAASSTAIQAPLGRGRTYSGNPISLDFQGADLRAVLRMFSEISGLNIVIDPAVQGSVDVMLTDVPWDQALDIILRANKLGYILDGTIVRVAPLIVLADEEGQRRKLSDEQALAGELHVLTKTLSYARAEDLQALLTKSSLSQRGTVQVDPRTNTVIITDLPDRLTTADSLLNTLDTPQPQVEIEARIVQTTKDFAKALGVQWGLAGRADPALGNTTNVAFPNSGSVTGRTGAVQGTPGQPSPSAVNLGVNGATSAVGLALGSINGAFNLDVALSALERSGNGRLLSTPRVSTQNNIEAEITQGIQIPIQTSSNNTVTVTFKDAALTLKVTPQITAAGTVIMKIAVENASPDFARSVNGIPPINTQRANTTVLLTDGQTTVIGGIYTSQEQMSSEKTPGLSRVPFISWLFKRDSNTDQSTELLIFITPRIVKA